MFDKDSKMLALNFCLFKASLAIIDYTSVSHLHSVAWRHNDGDNEAEKANSLSEDKNQNHSNEKLRLNGIHAHAHISNNTNCKTRGLRYININKKIDVWVPIPRNRSTILKPSVCIPSQLYRFHCQLMIEKITILYCRLLLWRRMTATMRP